MAAEGHQTIRLIDQPIRRIGWPRCESEACGQGGSRATSTQTKSRALQDEGISEVVNVLVSSNQPVNPRSGLIHELRGCPNKAELILLTGDQTRKSWGREEWPEVVAASLADGVAKGGSRRNREALDLSLAPLAILPLDETALWRYGDLRADLDRQGTPIGALDP